MIKFSLVCSNDHEFEGWFGSSKEFEQQQKRGIVLCPVCSDTAVTKSLMAPRVSGTKKSSDETVPMAQMPTPAVPQEMMDQLRKFKKHIEENAENVGERFPEEARKIHYGEVEARGIYGKATPEEATNLAEEGVNVMPIPDLPEEKN